MIICYRLFSFLYNEIMSNIFNFTVDCSFVTYLIIVLNYYYDIINPIKAL